MLLIRIQAIRRFIENQHGGIVQNRLRQTDAASKALRQRVDALLANRVELQMFEHVAQPVAAVLGAQAAQVGDKVQKAAHRHFAVAGRAFGQVAQAGFGRQWRRPDIVAAETGAARTGRDEARQHAHRGGLASAIGAEKTQHFAGAYLEAHRIDSHDAVVEFG